jgi:hypothetical protein
MASSPNFDQLRNNCGVLQRFFAQVRRFPTDQAAFARLYGAFDDPGQVADFIRLCGEINNIAAVFGSPATLKAQIAQNPDTLQAATPPAEIYAGIVQLAGMAGHAAGTFAETLSGFASLPGDAKARADAIKQLIAGSGGLVGAAVDVRDAALLLRRALAPLLPRIATSFTGFSANRVLNLANQALGALGAQLQRLQTQEAEAARNRDSAIFRKSAAEQAYADAKAARETADAEIARKQAFADQMEGLFSAGNAAVVASLDIDTAIQDIGGVFGDARDSLMNVATAASAEQLGDPAWLSNALDLTSAITRWKTLTEDASRFRQSSLVDLSA